MQEFGESRRILLSIVNSIDYSSPVNHQGIYSQALALYRQGFQYWYEGDEITSLNSRNENFRLKEPVEENLFFYFRAAKGKDINAKWYSASLSTINNKPERTHPVKPANTANARRRTQRQ